MQKIKLTTAVGGSILIALSATAWGAEPGWYLSGSAGATFLTDSDLTFDVPEVPGFPTFETKHDVGFGVASALGYGFSHNLRLEAEIGYRQNDLDRIRSGAMPGMGALKGDFSDGDVSALSFMANAFYDFATHTPWKPYIGGGIGAARVSINSARLGRTRIGGIDVPELRNAHLADDTDTVFAWQVGAGLGYALNPQFTLSVDYRYFATADPKFTDVDGVNFDYEYASHNASVNLRYQF